MYQALYRKWRPRSFDDVVGQEHITETLKRQIETGRLSHAYLFVGTRGTGKTTCAKILSRAVNCEHNDGGNPCNKCPSCLGIENNSILDVVELDAASNNGVDSVRALREEAIYTPAAVKKRVYIVDEVHMLTPAAFNALLKILEEPPQHLIFILATTEIHKIPATILSRCQRFSFRRISPENIAKRLNYVASQEGLTLTGEASELLSRLADGSMRDALSLLDQCSSSETIDLNHVLNSIGLAGSAETENLLRAVCEKDTQKALELIDRLYSGGRDMASLLDELINLERDILLTKLMPEGSSGLMSGTFNKSSLLSFSRILSVPRLISDMEILKNAFHDLSRLTNRKLAVELCIIRMCDSSLSGDISGLISRVSALESFIENLEKHGISQAAVHLSASGSEFEDTDDIPFDYDDEYSFPSDEDAPPSYDAPPFDVDLPVPDKNPEPTAYDNAQPPSSNQNSSSDNDWDSNWERILAVIKPEIDMPLFSFLGDSIHAAASFDNDTICVTAQNPIAMQMLNTPRVIDIIKEGALKILGRSVAVKITEGSASDDTGSDKLDELSKFGNIIFE